ncbi:MAG: NifU family protein [gamma proteobacterium endosymbiont of Trioza apicalis]
MITITNAAQEYFFRLLSKQKPGTQIRLFITNSRSFNKKCSISYCHINKIKLTDIELKFGKILIYIDNASISYLQGAKIDFIDNELNSKIIIKIPNIILNKNIKSNLLVKNIKNFIKNNINPVLLIHGGKIIFVKITKCMQVIIKFVGRCNGCFMIKSTFKEHIEKKLLKSFPEIKEICDITKHKHNKYSYY